MADRHVLFRVARERYALPLEAVREVVLPQPPFARVPRTAGAVRGVMNADTAAEAPANPKLKAQKDAHLEIACEGCQ